MSTHKHIGLQNCIQVNFYFIKFLFLNNKNVLRPYTCKVPAIQARGLARLWVYNNVRNTFATSPLTQCLLINQIKFVSWLIFKDAQFPDGLWPRLIIAPDQIENIDQVVRKVHAHRSKNKKLFCCTCVLTSWPTVQLQTLQTKIFTKSGT